MTAWGHPCPIGVLGWDPRAVLWSHQSWTLLNSRRCPSQRQRCQEDPQELGNKQPWELCFQTPRPPVMLAPRPLSRSCWLWGGPSCSRPVPFLTPRVHAYVRGYAVSDNRNLSHLPLTGHLRPWTAMGFYSIPPSPCWVQPFQHLPGISAPGGPLPRQTSSDTLQPWVTPLQPLTAALRISFYYHSMTTIKSN